MDDEHGHNGAPACTHMVLLCVLLFFFSYYVCVFWPRFSLVRVKLLPQKMDALLCFIPGTGESCERFFILFAIAVKTVQFDMHELFGNVSLSESPPALDRSSHHRLIRCVANQLWVFFWQKFNKRKCNKVLQNGYVVLDVRNVSDIYIYIHILNATDDTRVMHTKTNGREIGRKKRMNK